MDAEKKPRLCHSKRGFSSNHTICSSPSRMDMGRYLKGYYEILLAVNSGKGQEDYQRWMILV